MDADEMTVEHTRVGTPGERLIPLLLLVGEVCVGYALLLSLAITASFAGDPDSLVPFWGMLLILLGFYMSSKLFQRGSPTGVMRKVIEPLSWLPLALCFVLLFAWLNNYSQRIPLWSPAWLLALIQNFIPVTPGPDQPPGAWADIHVNITPAIQTVVLLVITGIAGWRGYRLAQKHLISDDIARLFTWGCIVIALLIALFLILFSIHKTQLSPLVPALLAATFLICVLTARSLHHVSYLRRFHRAKLWGSAASQERIVWTSMFCFALLAIVCAVLFGHATIAHPAPQPPQPRSIPGNVKGHHLLPQGTAAPWPFWLLIPLVVIVVGLVVFLLWRRAQKLAGLRRARKKRASAEAENNELHETIFNWSLFLSQVRSFLLAFLTHLNPFRRARKSAQNRTIDDLRQIEPGVRSVREIYRALLKWADRRGQARAADETPYEYWKRLGALEALTGPELEMITDAYVLARYGGRSPAGDEITHIKRTWSTLQQKWQ